MILRWPASTWEPRRGRWHAGGPSPQALPTDTDRGQGSGRCRVATRPVAAQQRRSHMAHTPVPARRYRPTGWGRRAAPATGDRGDETPGTVRCLLLTRVGFLALFALLSSPAFPVPNFPSPAGAWCRQYRAATHSQSLSPFASPCCAGLDNGCQSVARQYAGHLCRGYDAPAVAGRGHHDRVELDLPQRTSRRRAHRVTDRRHPPGYGHRGHTGRGRLRDGAGHDPAAFQPSVAVHAERRERPVNFPNIAGKGNVAGIFTSNDWSPLVNRTGSQQFIKEYLAKFGGSAGTIDATSAEAHAAGQNVCDVNEHENVVFCSRPVRSGPSRRPVGGAHR